MRFIHSYHRLIIKPVLICLVLFVPAIAVAQIADQPKDTTYGILSDTTVSLRDTVTSAADTTTDLVDEEDTDVVTRDTVEYFATGNDLPDSINKREWPDTSFNKVKQQPDFWYWNYMPPKMDLKKSGGSSNRWLSTLLWIIIVGAFVAFLIWFLAGNNIGIFRKKQAKLAGSKEEEAITENIFAINYQKEISKAINEGNYRFATRLMFLQLLRQMADKNIINYKPDRTNFDYLMQLQNGPYYADFFRVARNYEYTWYGQFDLTSSSFEIVKKDIAQLENQINKR